MARSASSHTHGWTSPYLTLAMQPLCLSGTAWEAAKIGYTGSVLVVHDSAVRLGAIQPLCSVSPGYLSWLQLYLGVHAACKSGHSLEVVVRTPTLRILHGSDLQ